MSARNAFYAQSGGVTAVINATACGVIQTARAHPEAIGTVYAGRAGILGALHEELIDTGRESAETIAALRHTPAGAFGSARYKLKGLDESRAEYERLIEIFKAHDIGYFFYNGGGDSQDTAHKVSQIGERLGHPVTCIGIPKTVDNDLPGTDSCPGFGSVAKYIAVSTREAGLDVRSMAETSTKVFVLETMGRHAGWIAAAAGLAREQDGDPPHVILLPEVAFDRPRFLARVQESVDRYGYCVVVVSEGARSADGTFLADQGSRDAFGHIQLGGVAPVVADMIRSELGYKYHYAVADYLQRAARHIASATDVEQAYALGRAAVEMALAGRNGVMPTIRRLADEPYRWEVGEAQLAEVANVEADMPREYISEDGFDITEACRRYLRPLIAGEDYPPYRNGLPEYARLRGELVEKRLPPFGG
ncbi:6-phosphofructokinase [Arhodomonas sp. SL1]|uniref:6-phosphofructokinase n=1 Tax=Arhodomonas sp. SL1 TaxID=3425691 RepID=UPI003F8821F4